MARGASNFKKLKENAPRAVTLVVLLALIIYLGSPYFSVVGGFTTLSIDEVTIESDNEYISGEVIQITTSVDGSARSASGTFSEASGILFEKMFTITQTAETQCEYQITEESFAVKDWKTVSTVSTVKSATCTLKSVGASCNCDSVDGYTVQKGTITKAYRTDYYSYCKSICTCPAYSNTNLGSINFFSSSTTYITEVNTTLEIDGEDAQEISLTSQNTQGQTEDMYVRLIAPSSGWATCPVPASDVVAYRAKGSADFELKADYLAQNVITRCSDISYYSDVETCNSAIDQFLDSEYSGFYTCETEDIDGTTTKVICTPEEAPVIPNTEIIIKADSIGIIIPVGEPNIISLEAGVCDAAEDCYVTATVKNDGEDEDSFDLTIQDLSSISTSVNLDGGETKTVELPYSAAGIAGDYEVTMVSVNDPTKIDTESVWIEVYPFCDENPPSSNHVLVYTEIGCQYVCEQDGTHIYDEDCEAVPEYPMDETAIEYAEEDHSYHCIAEGEYVKIGDYLEEQITFIPEEKEHQYWLAYPYCQYVAEYGYELENGEAVKVSSGYVFYESSAVLASDSSSSSSSSTSTTSTEEESTEEELSVLDDLPLEAIGIGLALSVLIAIVGTKFKRLKIK